MHHGRETTIKSTGKHRAAEQSDEPVSPDGSRRGSQSPGETREPDTRPEDAALQVEQLQVTRDLESIVTDFRNRKCGQSQAFTKIVGTLDRRTELTSEQKDQIIAVFSAEITAIQADFDRPLQQDGGAAGPSNFERRAEIRRGKRPQRDQSPGDVGRPTIQREPDIFPSVTGPATRVHSPRRPKRARSISSESGSDASESHGRSSKYPRVELSDMPWTSGTRVHFEPSPEPVISPYCEETCRILEVYARDPRCSRELLKLRGKGKPRGFPNSQWRRIFAGEPVDLDVVLSSINSITADEERTARFGDKELSFTVPESKRRVRTHADWCSAWDKTVHATGFLFPHRKRELWAHCEEINEEFLAQPDTSQHHRIIAYDKAVRIIVGGGEEHRLTDTDTFRSTYNAIILNDAPNVIRSGTGRLQSAPRQSGSKTEVCRNYNSARGCKNPNGECRFRHICSGCKKSGHGNADCNAGKE